MPKICEIILSADVFTAKQNLVKHSTVQHAKSVLQQITFELLDKGMAPKNIDLFAMHLKKLSSSL